MAASSLETSITGSKPVAGSSALTAPIMASFAGSGSAVNTPAWPSMVVSISALHGQTLTHWPQETQLDSSIGRS